MGLWSPEIAAEARPGQFLMIRVQDGIDPLLRRPFSICATQDREQVLILYRIVGRGTAIMSKRKPGERLWVLGPLGQGFDLPKNGKTTVLVAGGIGVAPLMSLAQALRMDQLSFMAGYRRAEEIVRLEELGMGHVNVALATDDGSEGHYGQVTDLLEDYVKRHEEDVAGICACGPVPMLKRIVLISAEREIECQVSLEAYMACGLGACLGCAVPASSHDHEAYHHVCKDGPVFNADAIDWERI
jgi:dihydroorotate dehydrogenase electron transfer subunit